MSQKRMKCFRMLFDHVAWIEHQFLRNIRHSRKVGSLWRMIRGVGGVRKSIHQSWLAKGLGLGLLCWNRVSDISTRSIHLSQLDPCHRPRWASTQFLSLSIVQTLLLVTFAYSLSSEAVIMRQLRWKRLWRRSLIRSHKRISMGPSRSCWNGTTSALQPEETTSKGTRVSCVYYQ